MARFLKFHIVSFILKGYSYSNALDCIPPRNASTRIISIQKPRHVSTVQQSLFARSKRKKFLCKNHLKIGCSNYIKNFVEKSCFFKASKRLFLKSYAKESSLYGAISHVLYFRKPPGSLRSSHNFCCFQNRYGAKLLVRNMPILIPLFLLIFS